MVLKLAAGLNLADSDQACSQQAKWTIQQPEADEGSVVPISPHAERPF